MSDEKKEFEVLFRDMYPKLYYAAIQLVKDEEVCRDIIGDSFVQLWTKRADIAPDKRPSFLFRIIRNKCVDFIRKQTVKNILDDIELDSKTPRTEKAPAIPYPLQR